jgi:hypothetical protein
MMLRPPPTEEDRAIGWYNYPTLWLHCVLRDEQLGRGRALSTIQIATRLGWRRGTTAALLRRCWAFHLADQLETGRWVAGSFDPVRAIEQYSQFAQGEGEGDGGSGAPRL